MPLLGVPPVCAACGHALVPSQSLSSPTVTVMRCPYYESHQLAQALIDDANDVPTQRSGMPCDCHLTLGQRGLHETWCRIG